MPQQRTPQEVALFIQNGGDTSTLSTPELQLGINILEGAERRSALQEGPPVRGGAAERFLGAAGETLKGIATPIIDVGKVASVALAPGGGTSAESGAAAARRLAALPGEVVQSQKETLGRGFDRVLAAVGFDEPTTKLTERGEQGAFTTGFVPEVPLSGSEKVKSGAAGLADILAGVIPFGPVARGPSEAIAQGDVAGGLGQFAGLAAPFAAGGLAGRLKPSVAESGTRTLDLPRGGKVEIPVTRGETGGPIVRTVERQIRGSELAGEPFKIFEEGRTAKLKEAGQEIAADISPVPGTLAGRGAAAKRGARLQNEAVLDEGVTGRQFVREQVIEANLTGETPRLKAALEAALPERVGAQEVIPIASNKATIGKIQEGLGEGGRRASVSQTEFLENMNPAQRAAAESQLGLAREGKASPVADQMTALKFLKAEGRRVQKSGETSLDVGLNKQLVQALQADIEASLRTLPGSRAVEGVAELGAGESLARDFTVANTRIRKAKQRPRRTPMKSLEAAKTQDVPKLLKTGDIREIPALRAMVGKERFEGMAAQLFADTLIEASGGKTPTTITKGPFSTPASVQPGPFKAFLRAMEPGGRGIKTFGKRTMQSIKDYTQILEGVAKAIGLDTVTFVGRMIDAGATVRLLTSGVVGGVIGALAGNPVAGVLTGGAAALSAPITMNIIARILVKPRGASIMKNVTRAFGQGNVAKQTFWITRLGEFMDNDPELKALADQRREELQQQQ